MPDQIIKRTPGPLAPIHLGFVSRRDGVSVISTTTDPTLQGLRRRALFKAMYPDVDLAVVRGIPTSG